MEIAILNFFRLESCRDITASKQTAKQILLDSMIPWITTKQNVASNVVIAHACGDMAAATLECTRNPHHL
jgi:hypothetical protein